MDESVNLVSSTILGLEVIERYSDGTVRVTYFNTATEANNYYYNIYNKEN